MAASNEQQNQRPEERVQDKMFAIVLKRAVLVAVQLLVSASEASMVAR